MSTRCSYLVRCRDVLAGTEHWLKDDAGNPVIFEDRMAADLAALIANQSSTTWQYAHAAELDLSCEEIAN